MSLPRFRAGRRDGVVPPENGRVVVVTGASSGIGRALAHEGARRGWQLALAARRLTALETLVEECRELGGTAIAVSLDVASEEQVDRLAERAIERFGRIDGWVNCAGVYLVGTFEQTPSDAFRRVIDVDLLGVVHGSRAALRVFRPVGRGTLVNVSSLVGGLASPYVTAYAAAKWGVRGFTLSLREELREDPGIQVCVVRPASIDTPIFRHAANYSGRPLKALSPTYGVQGAAVTVADLLSRPRRETILGRSGPLLAAAHAIAPPVVDRVFSSRVPDNQFAPGVASPTDGNLFEPDPDWPLESGGWTVAAGSRRTALAVGGAGLLLAVAAAAALRSR